jgi:hypothetical protein
MLALLRSKVQAPAPRPPDQIFLRQAVSWHRPRVLSEQLAA